MTPIEKAAGTAFPARSRTRLSRRWRGGPPASGRAAGGICWRTPRWRCRSRRPHV